MGYSLGQYSLLCRLGRGGGASVFLARDATATRPGRLVALKVMLPELAARPEARRAFLNEARLSARLKHPHIVTVTGHGENGGTYAMAMEYVFGGSLRDVLAVSAATRRSLSIGVVLYVVARVAEALEFAHKRAVDGRPLGIIHRDVSPENVLIGFDGVPKLADFGIAKAVDRGFETAAGILKGKARYVSPEQLLARKLDPRHDVFQLGIVAWETITGRTLFDGATLLDTFRQIQSKRIPPPSELVPGVPEIVDRVILKALARTPRQRFESAGELASTLDTLLGMSGSFFDASVLAHELHQLYGEEVPRRAEALRAAIQGHADGVELAEVLGAEPLSFDQLPELGAPGTALEFMQWEAAIPALVREHPEPPPVRTEQFSPGAATLPEDFVTVDAGDDLEELMKLEPEPRDEIGEVPADGWEEGNDTIHDASELLLGLSEDDLRSGNIPAAYTAALSDLVGPNSAPYDDIAAGEETVDDPEAALPGGGRDWLWDASEQAVTDSSMDELSLPAEEEPTAPPAIVAPPPVTLAPPPPAPPPPAPPEGVYLSRAHLALGAIVLLVTGAAVALLALEVLS